MSIIGCPYCESIIGDFVPAHELEAQAKRITALWEVVAIAREIPSARSNHLADLEDELEAALTHLDALLRTSGLVGA